MEVFMKFFSKTLCLSALVTTSLTHVMCAADKTQKTHTQQQPHSLTREERAKRAKLFEQATLQRLNPQPEAPITETACQASIPALLPINKNTHTEPSDLEDARSEEEDLSSEEENLEEDDDYFGPGYDDDAVRPGTINAGFHNWDDDKEEEEEAAAEETPEQIARREQAFADEQALQQALLQNFAYSRHQANQNDDHGDGDIEEAIRRSLLEQ